MTKVLLCVIASLIAQAEDVSFERALEEECKDFHDFYARQVDWDEEVVKLAEREAQLPGGTDEDAYMKLDNSKTFNGTDQRSLRTKVRVLFMGLVKHVPEIKHLAPGTKYGCNGAYQEEGNPRNMTVVCLYRKDTN